MIQMPHPGIRAPDAMRVRMVVVMVVPGRHCVSRGRRMQVTRGRGALNCLKDKDTRAERAEALARRVAEPRFLEMRLSRSTFADSCGGLTRDGPFGAGAHQPQMWLPYATLLLIKVPFVRQSRWSHGRF